MLKVRLIPCLDVKDGRVVKGVNFVDLVDAGDPVVGLNTGFSDSRIYRDPTRFFLNSYIM